MKINKRVDNDRDIEFNYIIVCKTRQDNNIIINLSKYYAPYITQDNIDSNKDPNSKQLTNTRQITITIYSYSLYPTKAFYKGQSPINILTDNNSTESKIERYRCLKDSTTNLQQLIPEPNSDRHTSYHTIIQPTPRMIVVTKQTPLTFNP